MADILEQLASYARVRVEESKKKIPPETIRRLACGLPYDTGFPFEKALWKEGMSFIAECKKASPSKGLIDPDFPYLQIAREYEQTVPLAQAGFFDFGEFHFEVYLGKGGHLPGETVLIDYEHHIAFTGDIYINIHGMTREQAEYNKCAPVLMSGVDTDPALCAEERKAVFQRLGAGEWSIFGAHGAVKEYHLKTE